MACEDDENGTGPEPAREFAATLSGANERPDPVDPAGTGTATFAVDTAETTISYTLSNLTSNANNAHIHIGNATVAGGVIVPLGFEPATSFTTNGTITTQATLPIAFQSLLDLMRAGDVYVNVHTVANPGGEIRGQVQPD